MTTRAHFAIAASVLLAVSAVESSAGDWDLKHAVYGSGGQTRFGVCSATLDIGPSSQPITRYMRWSISGGSVFLRRVNGEDETKPMLIVAGFGPHYTRSRDPLVAFPLPRCWLDRDDDGEIEERCEYPPTEHRITYRIGNGDREEAWVKVASSSGYRWFESVGAFLPDHWRGGIASNWWDWPDELFATNDRQLLRLDAGGNSRPNRAGWTSPSSLLIELRDARSVMAQLQRCAQRYRDAGLFDQIRFGNGDGDPHGHVLGMPGGFDASLDGEGFDASLDGDVPTDGEWDWSVDEP